MEFSRRRRLGGLGGSGGGLGVGIGDGGDLRSLAAEVVGEEEESEDAADYDREQGDGNG